MTIPPLTDERRHRICNAAAAWLNTPFVPYARIRGVGADCVNLPTGVLVEADVFDRIDLPEYTIDGGRHLAESILVEWLRGDPRFQERLLNFQVLDCGDLLCFQIGAGVAHHLGLVLDVSGRFIHCIRHHNTLVSEVRDPTYRSRLTNIFRPRWASAPTTI